MTRNTDIQSLPAKPKTSASFLPQLVLCLVLATLTFAAYLPVRDCQFINYDDPGYVTENKIVQRGLNAETVNWAFRTGEMSNWHPLTWISYLVDWELFGENASGFHLNNLLFHVANTILLFLFLREITAARWKSFVVAALFGLHPLHVESVAWISERKDVLSGLFFILSLWAYCAYAQSKARGRWKARGFYYGALLFFALGLMSKPMLVTLPFVLLLLDLWPLQRVFPPGTPNEHSAFKPSIWKAFPRLIVEKWPFFLLTALGCFITFAVQAKGGAVSSLKLVPPGLRIGNAFVSCFVYLRKMFWPNDLAVFYPYHNPEQFLIFAAIVFILGISALALLKLRGCAVFAVGWFWYLGMLVPVIGIVQVGAQALADRYMYLPMIGVSIVVVWGMADLTRFLPARKVLLSTLVIGLVVACFFATRKQVLVWKSSETLWSHAIAVTKENDLAYYNLGGVLVAKGEYEEALPLFQKAIEIYPRYPEAHDVLGQIYARKGNFDKAREHYQLALRYRPDFADAHNNYGKLLTMMGKPDDAVAEYRKAVEILPDLWEARFHLANTLFSLGKNDEALQQYGELVRRAPENWQAHVSLGMLEKQKGNSAAAAEHFLKALEIHPEYAEGHLLLGNLLLDNGQTNAAAEQFRAALQLQPDYAEATEKLQTITPK